MIAWRLRNRVRELFWLPPLPPPGGGEAPPHPHLELVLGPTAPGALVRLFPAMLMGVVGVLLIGSNAFGWILIGVASVAITWRPGWQVAAGFALLTGGWLLATGDLLAVNPSTGAVEGLWRASALILTVHALFAATALAGHVAWRALVEGAVLWRAARSVLGAQAITQTLLLLSAWLRASLVGPGSHDLLRIIGVGAVLAVALLALPREWLSRGASSAER